MTLVWLTVVSIQQNLEFGFRPGGGRGWREGRGRGGGPGREGRPGTAGPAPGAVDQVRGSRPSLVHHPTAGRKFEA